MIQKEKRERRRKGKGRIAAVLAVVLMVTSVSAITTFADCTADLESSAVSISLPTVAADDTSFDEIDVASVVLDFYQVTPAVDLKGYDAYEFGDWAEAFASCKTEWEGLVKTSKERTLTAGEINTFTQNLAAVVLDGKASPAISATGALGSDPTSVTVPGGMYLVLAHSADAALTDYAVKTTDAAGKVTYATKADGETKRYMFAPMLVTAPVKDTTSLGTDSITAVDEKKVEITIPVLESNTAQDSGKWADAASLVVKVGVMDLEGRLKITKNLLNHESMWNRTDKATFVYRLEAVNKKGETVYRGAEEIVFEAGASTKSVVVDHIPMGATVTVTEIYTGGDYKPVGESVKTATITKADPETGEVAEVVFTNEHNGGRKGGGSVKNTYGTTSNDGGITWTWSDTPAPSYADDTSIR